MINLKNYFREALKAGASDLHLVGDELPRIRIQGELKALSDKPLSAKELESSIEETVAKDQWAIFSRDMELDFAHEQDGVRFRINLHREDGKIGMAARLIPATIPTPKDLVFEPALLSIPEMLDGLVIVTGPTGCGKTTTLAAIVEQINSTRNAHIVTVEDPIEFIFEDKLSLIEQREVGGDTKSFAAALKYVLRQDPNVILVGEMRDPETIAMALTAAETGHLVLSTLHTSTAAEAIERIVDVFEGARQKQVLLQLSASLRMVVAQELLPTKKDGRVPAREILVNTQGVANLIKENNINQIKSAIQTGAKDGMVTMENSIKQLLKDDVISEEVAENRSLRHKKV